MSRFRVKLNYTPTLLYPHACVTHAHIHDRYPDHSCCRERTVESAVICWRISGNVFGGPLLEKIRLDNATVPHSRETVVELNKKIS